MNIETFREYCLSLPCSTEALPFDNNTLVFKVKDKIFAITDLDEFKSINLKCAPEKAEELRAEYVQVNPGYHMNKKHWNTVEMDGYIEDKLLKEWILDSYKLVVQKLKVGDRNEVLELLNEA